MQIKMIKAMIIIMYCPRKKGVSKAENISIIPFFDNGSLNAYKNPITPTIAIKT